VGKKEVKRIEKVSANDLQLLVEVMEVAPVAVGSGLQG